MMYRFNSVVCFLAHFATTSAPKYFSHHSKPTSVFRKVLPLEFSRNVVRLTCESTAGGGVCDVYLVGCIHGHPKSLQDVKAVVNFVKPQAVFLELCPARATWVNPTKPQVKTWSLGPFVLEITLSRYRDKLARMPFWVIVRGGLSILFEPKKKPNLDDRCKGPTIRLDEASPENPVFAEIVIDERDQYMSAKLLEVAREHNSVVAVVGKGHVLGIQKYWKQPIEVEKLLSVPVVCRFRLILFITTASLICCGIYIHKEVQKIQKRNRAKGT